MKTVSQAAQQVLERSPYFSDILSEGIGNIAEIARRIRPEVEQILYENVSDAAVAMALHRIAKDLQRPVFGTRFLKQLSDITVRSNLVEYVFPNTPETAQMIETVSGFSGRKRSAFFTYSRGLHETLLVISAEFDEEIRTASKGSKHVHRTAGLSAITLRLPEESLNVPGVYYPILKALALEGISFIEVMSVRTELSIIFEDGNVDRAFSVIKRITA
ncbi:MAG: hypothetical protein JO019_01060 [Candidatus Kaiserbacteria bacterium]|nr:hypothetical protein [Candidatus Kaiserbacteria bacterium]